MVNAELVRVSHRINAYMTKLNDALMLMASMCPETEYTMRTWVGTNINMLEDLNDNLSEVE